MLYQIEEFFGDTWIKTSESDDLSAATEQLNKVSKENHQHKRKGGVRVMKGGDQLLCEMKEITIEEVDND